MEDKARRMSKKERWINSLLFALIAGGFYFLFNMAFGDEIGWLHMGISMGVMFLGWYFLVIPLSEKEKRKRKDK